MRDGTSTYQRYSMNDIVNNYFQHCWSPNYEKFAYTGYALMNQILPDETVLDVGCGHNLFKEYLGNQIYGIDPNFKQADEQVALEDFVPNGRIWTHAFCLGSLNFGSQQKIESQILKISGMITDCIFWRQNPGIIDHVEKEEFAKLDLFPWSFELNKQMAEALNFKVVECKWDTHNRIYAVWQKTKTIK